MSYIEVLRKFHSNTVGFRDPILSAVLAMVNPTRIVEVGTTRNLAKMHRFSDGWATFAFVNHLAQGVRSVTDIRSLYVADPDSQATDIAYALGRESDVDRFLYTDGIPAILSAQVDAYKSAKPSADDILVYLDGANDEHGMKDQFEWCDIHQRTSVLCDDLNEKGSGLIKYLSNYPELARVVILIQFSCLDIDWEGTHTMMFIPSRDLKERLGMQAIAKNLADVCAKKVMFNLS